MDNFSDDNTQLPFNCDSLLSLEAPSPDVYNFFDNISLDQISTDTPSGFELNRSTAVLLPPTLMRSFSHELPLLSRKHSESFPPFSPAIKFSSGKISSPSNSKIEIETTKDLNIEVVPEKPFHLMPTHFRVTCQLREISKLTSDFFRADEMKLSYDFANFSWTAVYSSGSTYLKFQISIYSDSDSNSQFIVEGNRLKGDSHQFHNFYKELQTRAETQFGSAFSSNLVDRPPTKSNSSSLLTASLLPPPLKRTSLTRSREDSVLSFQRDSSFANCQPYLCDIFPTGKGIDPLSSFGQDHDLLMNFQDSPISDFTFLDTNSITNQQDQTHQFPSLDPNSSKEFVEEEDLLILLDSILRMAREPFLEAQLHAVEMLCDLTSSSQSGALSGIQQHIGLHPECLEILCKFANYDAISHPSIDLDPLLSVRHCGSGGLLEKICMNSVACLTNLSQIPPCREPLIRSGVIPRLFDLASDGPFYNLEIRKAAIRILASLSSLPRLGHAIVAAAGGSASVRAWVDSVDVITEPHLRLHADRARQSLIHAI